MLNNVLNLTVTSIQNHHKYSDFQNHHWKSPLEFTARNISNSSSNSLSNSLQIGYKEARIKFVLNNVMCVQYYEHQFSVDYSKQFLLLQCSNLDYFFTCWIGILHCCGM